MNPFDDNYHDDKNPFSSSSSNRNDGLSRNPFDGDDGIMPAARATSTTIRSLDDDNDDDDIDVVNDIDNHEQEAQNNDTSISAEASWQYLGDLPYRRVPIYTNVRWETSTTTGKTTMTSKDPLKGRTTSTTTSSTIYDDPTKSVVKQQSNNNNHHQQSYGLASFPTRSLLLSSSSSSNNHHHRTTNFSNPRILLSKTTMTKCVGCPNGGPIAIVTLPLPSAGGTSSNRNTITTTNPFTDNNHATPTIVTSTSTVPIRILTVSGKLLSCIDFPPLPSSSSSSSLKLPSNNNDATTITTTTAGSTKIYGPTDIFAIGFTNRCILIIIMKDSYCYTYNLRGEAILSPFYLFSSTTTITGAVTASAAGTSNWCELQMVHIYEGGIAAVTTNNDTALVELFDQYDKDLDYISTIHKSARCVVSSSASSKLVTNTSRVAAAATTTTNLYGVTTTSTGLEHHVWIKNQSTEGIPSNYAIITYLPTALYAASHSIDYRAVAVLPRTRTSSRHPEIFLSTSDHSVIVVNVTTLRCTDVNCRARISSPIIDMSFAPNGRFLACYTESSMLTVISTSFETKVLDFDASEGSKAPPLELKWCGEDSVVLHWKNLGILMVGPYGDWLRFPYEHIDNVFVLPEIDCCRVITDTSVEILQRVPPTTAQLLRIGSIETAAMLLDASDAYHRADSSSSTATTVSSSNDDSTVRAIIEGGSIDDAIEACIDAARKEFDIYTQKRLLRAASYGMHFSYKTLDSKSLIGGPISGSNGDGNMNEDFGILPTKLTARFVTAARSIRILNALRHPDVGFVITATQLDAITPTGVVARLVAMKQPALASAISKYLRLPKTVHLYTRTCMAATFIESAPIQMSDSDIAKRAICIINGNTSVDHVTFSNGSVSSSSNSNMNRGAFATVAQTANKVGRPGVANLLLMLESSVADKVPALISTGSYADALAVATTARDADYIFSALLDYERACLMNAANTNDVAKAQATFLATVVSKFTTEAFHTLRRYLQSAGDMNSLLSLLLKAQRYSDAGIAMGRKATKTDDFREKQGMLAEASRMFGLGKETAFLKTATDDYIDLLKDQETLRAKYGTVDVAPVTSSVTTAIAAILCYAATSQDQRERMQLLADAEKLARKARMTPKRLYHIRVKAYADAGHWTTLAELAESRQTPIGYKPFIRAAISGYHASNRDDYILSLIQKLGTNEEKFDMLGEAGMWKQALKLAEKDMRDIRRLKQVKDRCTDKAIQIEAGEALSRLPT